MVRTRGPSGTLDGKRRGEGRKMVEPHLDSPTTEEAGRFVQGFVRGVDLREGSENISSIFFKVFFFITIIHSMIPIRPVPMRGTATEVLILSESESTRRRTRMAEVKRRAISSAWKGKTGLIVGEA